MAFRINIVKGAFQAAKNTLERIRHSFDDWTPGPGPGPPPPPVADDFDRWWHVTFEIGSDLPYASHWIEEGWREDPRYGLVRINYHTPPAGGANFLDAGAARFNEVVGQHYWLTGVRVSNILEDDAEDAARVMRQTLQRNVYNQEPYNPTTKRRWRRTYALMDSIRVERID